MIRLFISQDADDALIQESTGFIATWLNSYQAWEDQAHGPNEEPTLREPIEGEPFYAADWRFEWSESKAVLLDNLWGHVEPRAPWARLGYHECLHGGPGETGGPCEWSDKREFGSIPSNVPTVD